jgi:putative hydrolase of the HAD superfamily
MSAMYKCVFLDLDDTVWNFHDNARLSLSDIFEQRKLNRYFVDFQEFFAIYYAKNAELWELYGKGAVTQEFLIVERFRYSLSQMGVNDERLSAEIAGQYLEILPTQKKLMPNAIETLEYLSAKYPLSLVSNGFTQVQYQKIRSSGIEHYFTHIVLSENAGALKPDPRIFRYALTLNNALPSEAVMIGDSLASDIWGAKNAGIASIFLSPSPPPANSNIPQGTITIGNLKELRQLL